jgi:predicted GNAT superfamily acetyltransferase
MQKFGFKGVRFKENAYELNTPHFQSIEIPNDKVLVKWDLLCDETLRKIEGKFDQISLTEALQKFPVVTQHNLADNKYVLVEIPNDFKLMKETQFERAMEWRKSVQIVFSEYLNKKNYIIIDCLSSRIEKVRKTYYLLEKQ